MPFEFPTAFDVQDRVDLPCREEPVSGIEPAPEDMDRAHDLLSRWSQPLPVEDDIRIVALAISAVRRSHSSDAISNDELLAVHDRLCESPMRHRASDPLESLAVALLHRGIVPESDDYGGTWWLWWPKKGRGLCPRCGKDRFLTRYSERFGKPYRYLCERCRKQEIADATAYLDQVTGVTSEPGDSTGSLFSRRMTAILSGLSSQPQYHPPPRIGEPSAKEWARRVDNLEQLLAPFTQSDGSFRSLAPMYCRI